MPGHPKFPVRRLKIDIGLQFAFKPSIGMVARDVDTFGMDIRSFREPLKRSIQRVMAPSFKANFDMGGRPNKWEPLAEYTTTVRGDSGPVLNRSGLLKKTIQQLNVWSIDSQKAAIVDLPSKIWYGKLHQAGVGLPGDSGAIPQREFVLIQDEDYDKIEEVFANWLVERAIRSGAFKKVGGGFPR